MSSLLHLISHRRKTILDISYKCIGAKLRILLHFLPLSSWPTTLLKRLPIGSPPLLISTQALSSNFTTLPSGREYFFAVRTITACRMSPRRTLLAADTETLPPGPDSGPKLRCFCTTTMMRSPVGGVLGWGRVLGGKRVLRRTDSGGAVHFEDVDAFGDGGAGVVDDIEHGLGGVSSCCVEVLELAITLSWIILAVSLGDMLQQLLLRRGSRLLLAVLVCA